jgi:hypothetical protein
MVSFRRQSICLNWAKHHLKLEENGCKYGNSCRYAHKVGSPFRQVHFPSYLRYPLLKALAEKIDTFWVIEEIEKKDSRVHFIETEKCKVANISNIVEEVQTKAEADVEKSFQNYFEKHPRYGSKVVQTQLVADQPPKTTKSVADIKKDEKSLRFWSVHKDSTEIIQTEDLKVSTYKNLFLV